MRGMAIEVNLLGMVEGSHPDPCPSWDVVGVLADEGARLYVASDAHDTAGFKNGIPAVIETHQRLMDMNARFHLE